MELKPPFTPGIRLVAIGDELVNGHTQDTNSREIIRALDEMGLRVREVLQVRDESTVLQELVRGLLKQDGGLDLVVSTGGLGPTLDDRTRQALAEAFGAALVFDEARWHELLAWFRERGREAGAIHRCQALHPVPGGSLKNDVGTASGLVFTGNGRLWIALPGVPSEMRHLLIDRVMPLLAERYGLRGRGRVLAFRTRRLPEADLHQRLEPLADLAALGELGFYPSPDGVLLRLRLPDEAEPALSQHVEQARELIRRRLGPFLLHEGGEPVVELVLCRLKERGESLALAESCTGGWLARDLTDIPGASDVFPGGVVAYSNQVKQDLLDVPQSLLDEFGAVSAECVKAMAAGVRCRLGADWGLAVSGIAGPGGGSLEKPVGTVWLGLATVRGEEARLLALRGNRGQIRQRAVGQAWSWLLEHLLVEEIAQP